MKDERFWTRVVAGLKITHQVDAVADMEENGEKARADLWPNQNQYGQLILPIDMWAGVIDQPVTDLGSMSFTLGIEG